MTESHNGSRPGKLRIGSRGSQLALWQANHISALLRARGHEVEIEIIHTTGDKITDVALAMVGTKGMFTKEIEEALAAGRVDLAVHSLKDLPTELPPGFEIAAIQAPKTNQIQKRTVSLPHLSAKMIAYLMPYLASYRLPGEARNRLHGRSSDPIPTFASR